MRNKLMTAVVLLGTGLLQVGCQNGQVVLDPGTIMQAAGTIQAINNGDYASAAIGAGLLLDKVNCPTLDQRQKNAQKRTTMNRLQRRIDRAKKEGRNQVTFVDEITCPCPGGTSKGFGQPKISKGQYETEQYIVKYTLATTPALCQRPGGSSSSNSAGSASSASAGSASSTGQF